MSISRYTHVRRLLTFQTIPSPWPLGDVRPLISIEVIHKVIQLSISLLPYLFLLCQRFGSLSSGILCPILLLTLVSIPRSLCSCPNSAVPLILHTPRSLRVSNIFLKMFHFHLCSRLSSQDPVVLPGNKMSYHCLVNFTCVCTRCI